MGLNQGARVAAGPFKMSAEAMKDAKGKAETAWSLGLCPICRESIKGGKVFGGGKEVEKVGGGWGLGCRGWCGELVFIAFFSGLELDIKMLDLLGWWLFVDVFFYSDKTKNC